MYRLRYRVSVGDGEAAPVTTACRDRAVVTGPSISQQMYETYKRVNNKILRAEGGKREAETPPPRVKLARG